MNPYRVLGISINDTESVRKRKYRELCKKYHPDGLGGGSRESFDEVQNAWKMLQNVSPSLRNKSTKMWRHKSLFTLKRV